MVNSKESPGANPRWPLPLVLSGSVRLKGGSAVVTLIIIGTSFTVPVAVRTNPNDPPPFVFVSFQSPPAFIIPRNVYEPLVILIEPLVMFPL
jgi:hypothetical protein